MASMELVLIVAASFGFIASINAVLDLDGTIDLTVNVAAPGDLQQMCTSFFGYFTKGSNEVKIMVNTTRHGWNVGTNYTAPEDALYACQELARNGKHFILAPPNGPSSVSFTHLVYITNARGVPYLKAAYTKV